MRAEGLLARLVSRQAVIDRPDGLGDPTDPDSRRRGVTTDPSLIQEFYKLKGENYFHAVATDSFLGKSRNEYNPPWLARELVQNFVDHNPEHPGTLDGVNFTVEELPDGVKRFRIQGDWPFTDPTGILSPHSDKPEGMNTAGGNGIGLKQTAIRLLRDFGVEKFEIEGDGWTTNYRLAKAADINAEWRVISPQTVPVQPIRHDWLLVEVGESVRRNTNAYIIETKDPVMIKALSEFPSLGVSLENPFLQNADYESPKGKIKWLTTPDAAPTEPNGRLYINGQVMNFKRKGGENEDYWVGPEAVTLQLNGVDYKISVDRPPVTSWDLRTYIDPLVKAMAPGDLIEQLKRSEGIWGTQLDSRSMLEQKGAFVVIQKMVEQLRFARGYTKDQYAQIFPDRKYLCWNSGVSESQVRDLEKQGYIICSGYFQEIGMPTASSRLDSLDTASNEVPTLNSFSRDKFAQEVGMEVGFEDFSGIKSIPDFFKMIGTRLAPRIYAVEEREGRPNTLRLKLNGEIPKGLLSKAILKGDGEGGLLNIIRGMAAYGIDRSIFKKIFTSQGEFVTTFAYDYDLFAEEKSLSIRNVKASNSDGVFIEVELDESYSKAFATAMREAVETFRNAGGPTDQALTFSDSTPVYDQFREPNPGAELDFNVGEVNPTGRVLPDHGLDYSGLAGASGNLRSPQGEVREGGDILGGAEEDEAYRRLVAKVGGMLDDDERALLAEYRRRARSVPEPELEADRINGGIPADAFTKPGLDLDLSPGAVIEDSADVDKMPLPVVDEISDSPIAIVNGGGTGVNTGEAVAAGVDSTTSIKNVSWTPEQEELYKRASAKKPEELTDEDREILKRRDEIVEQFNDVDISHPKPAVEKRGAVVIEKEGQLSSEEQERLNRLEEELPGISDMVEKLEQIIPEAKPAESANKTAIEKYLEWRGSGDFYGQLGENSGYLTGRNLLDIIEEQNQADIPVVANIREVSPTERTLAALKKRLNDVVDRMTPEGDEIDDFDIVLEPTPTQLAQLGLLRLYTQLSTGVDLPNDFFVYKGTGSKGINLGGKAIGINEESLRASFTENLSVFIHEASHNYPEADDHGNMFRHAMQSLFVTTIDRLSSIADKAVSGEPVATEEKVVLDIQREWNKLRAT